MSVVKGIGVTVNVDDEIIELKQGDDLSALPKKVRDAVEEAEARGQGDAVDALTAEWPKDSDPAVTVGGIDNFDDLTARDAIAAITAENAAAVKEYEQAHKDRSTVIAACDTALEPSA